jgi:hypothetical protein
MSKITSGFASIENAQIYYETAGTFDMDAEMKIYISGNPTPIQREFKRGTDIVGVQKVLAGFILK